MTLIQARRVVSLQWELMTARDMLGHFEAKDMARRVVTHLLRKGTWREVLPAVLRAIPTRDPDTICNCTTVHDMLLVTRALPAEPP